MKRSAACVLALLWAGSVFSETYDYAGQPFDAAGPGIFAVGDRIGGQFSTAEPLPADLPLQDIRTLLLDFHFSDTQQTYTPGNTSIRRFEIATDARGNIFSWTILLWALPVPDSAAGTVDGLLTASDPDGWIIEAFRDAPCEPPSCQFALPDTGADDFALAGSTIGSAGVWTTGTGAAVSVPALSPLGLFFLVALLAAGSLGHRSRLRQGYLEFSRSRFPPNSQ